MAWRPVGGAAFVAILFFHVSSCYSEQPPYSTFATDATSAPPESQYDYIVIGGGTAGCALATTLSERHNVLLLERGGLPYGNRNIENRNGFIDTLVDASPSSASQVFVSTDGVISHRPRVLGGGSALNAGFYTRASAEYENAAGWDHKLVSESYEWVEPKLVFEPPMLEWQSTVRDGLLEAGVVPDNGFTYEHLNGTKFGGTIFDHNDRRHTAADLLEYADPTKITVYLKAVVQQILFRTQGNAGEEKPRAYGVEFVDAHGNKHGAFLKTEDETNEIIVSAGALGSPQLLMLSGVGPSRHLSSHGLRVVLDQPNVGQGMADNPMNALFIPSSRKIELSLIEIVGITNFGSFIEADSSMYLEWAHRKLESARSFLNPIGRPLLQTGASQVVGQLVDALMNASLSGGMILEKVDGPFSTGHLELETTNPNDNPKVTFNYFSDPRDLQACVQGMNKIIEVTESEAMSKYRNPSMPVQVLINLMLALPVNLRPKHLSAAVSMEQFCKDTVMSIWHYHGGCQVGKVVDSDYKVLGVDSLRVVDGSTFLNSPGTNPQATVMMLGRYVGQRILQGFQMEVGNDGSG